MWHLDTFVLQGWRLQRGQRFSYNHSIDWSFIDIISLRQGYTNGLSFGFVLMCMLGIGWFFCTDDQSRSAHRRSQVVALG
jgi:hypothetical protein